MRTTNPDGLIETLNKHDATLISSKQVSSHPNDSHLFVVLAFWDRKEGREYIVWNYNSYDLGLSAGHYCTALDPALEKFNKRGETKV